MQLFGRKISLQDSKTRLRSLIVLSTVPLAGCIHFETTMEGKLAVHDKKFGVGISCKEEFKPIKEPILFTTKEVPEQRIQVGGHGQANLDYVPQQLPIQFSIRGSYKQSIRKTGINYIVSTGGMEYAELDSNGRFVRNSVEYVKDSDGKILQLFLNGKPANTKTGLGSIEYSFHRLGNEIPITQDTKISLIDGVSATETTSFLQVGGIGEHKGRKAICFNKYKKSNDIEEKSVLIISADTGLVLRQYVRRIDWFRTAKPDPEIRHFYYAYDYIDFED